MKKRKIVGTDEMPRLKVHRTNKYLYVQIINDIKGITILGLNQKHLEVKNQKLVESARALGLLIAQKAKAKKITKVVFDRGSKAYHGIVKALAEGAREGGLKF